MAVGSIESKFYDILKEKLGLSESELEQFDDYEENRKRLTDIFKEKTQDEWCTVFDGTDACVTPVLSLEAAADNEHNIARSSFVKSNTDNRTIVPRPAPRLSRTPGYTRDLNKHFPGPGEHSVDILLECGFESDEIHRLIKSGIVYQADLANKL